MLPSLQILRLLSIVLTVQCVQQSAQDQSTADCSSNIEFSKDIVEFDLIQLHLGIIGRESVRQIEYSSRVTAVHLEDVRAGSISRDMTYQYGNSDTFAHGLDENAQNVIVNDLTCFLEIDRDQCRIVAFGRCLCEITRLKRINPVRTRLFIAIAIFDPTSVSYGTLEKSITSINKKTHHCSEERPHHPLDCTDKSERRRLQYSAGSVDDDVHHP